jgi:hypothetical protein
VRAVDQLALRSTAVMQTGSLPVYLGMVLLTLVAVPGTALVAQTSVSGDLRAYDTPLQLVVAVGSPWRRSRRLVRTAASPQCCTWGRSATASPCCSCCRAVPTWP